jgi:hypothetical protein
MTLHFFLAFLFSTSSARESVFRHVHVSWQSFPRLKFDDIHVQLGKFLTNYGYILRGDS